MKIHKSIWNRRSLPPAGTVDGDYVVIPASEALSIMEQRGVRAMSQKPRPLPPPPGPGTELKALLKKVGINASPNCSCNARARKMNEMEQKEPGWCEAHIDEIVGWLREEATKRKLPFIDAAGRLLVRRAIANARRKSNLTQ